MNLWHLNSPFFPKKQWHLLQTRLHLQLNTRDVLGNFLDTWHWSLSRCADVAENGYFHRAFDAQSLRHFNYFLHIFNNLLRHFAVHIAYFDSWHLLDDLLLHHVWDLYHYFFANDLWHFNDFFNVLDVFFLDLLVNPTILNAENFLHQLLNLNIGDFNNALLNGCLGDFHYSFLELIRGNPARFWQNCHSGRSRHFFFQFHLSHSWKLNDHLLKSNLRTLHIATKCLRVRFGCKWAGGWQRLTLRKWKVMRPWVSHLRVCPRTLFRGDFVVAASLLWVLRVHEVALH
mmetsp:Transcript_121773/g.242573  ORF Transcript_121773/g.242573 Transcript_121773/m.242573 type:complete len:287 (-) Transcript_121773:89-949(-)